MKPHFYIHRNLYARGIGFYIVREGILVFNFWFWHLSGCIYFGKRCFYEESFQNRLVSQLETTIIHCEARIATLEKALKDALSPTT